MTAKEFWTQEALTALNNRRDAPLPSGENAAFRSGFVAGWVAAREAARDSYPIRPEVDAFDGVPGCDVCGGTGRLGNDIPCPKCG